MRHARNDYNRIQDPEKKIPEDEPVFLLRAQDEVAAEVVWIWAILNKARGGCPALSDMATTWADVMDKWPIKKRANLPS